MDAPRVLEIQIAEDKGLPMQSLNEANVVESGIEGDRYAANKGAWSKARQTVRHISLIEQEAIDAANTEFKISTTFEDTRRNILTIDIPLNDLVGKKFLIGEVLVEGVELCDPCGRPGILSKRDDLRAHFEQAFQNRGGLRVRVLGTGKIHQGDAIRLEE